MESNDTGTSSAVKEKLSLRKRLLIKKSTRVGCSIETSPVDRSITDIGDFSKSSTNLFLSKRMHENGERTYSSDSEATTSRESRLPNSTSTFLTTQSTQAVTRPKSMVEDDPRSKDISGSEKYLDRYPEHSRSSPINKSIEALKKPQIFKAHSDPNCDAKINVYNDSRTLPTGRCVQSDSQRRISSSLSEMQHSSDDFAMSDYEVVDRSLNESGRDSSVQSCDGARSMEAKLSHTPRSGSTDSLARNSLLAAKVLRLIPTQKARERNFLHGRLASNSLLGAAELERVFPNREVEIFVGTWNMNGQTPPSELNDFLFPSAIKNVPDILAIGTQESISERAEWEISIQESLGPSHLLLHSTTLGTLHLSVFIRRDLIWFCSLPEDASISVRPGTAFRTKGAVAISFALFGTTFLFVTAHLTAHQEKVKERVHDIKRIIRALDLPKNLPMKHKNKDVTCNFDVVMWCGDLNFRLSEDRASVLRGLAGSNGKHPSGLPKAASASEILPTSFPSVLRADQLSAVLAAGTILRGFKEAPIYFPPTYKYDPGTQRFDTSSKQRAPAYTDRILYKTRIHAQTSSSLSGFRRASSAPVAETFSSVHCLAYDSVPSICSSDHKPVWALFTASLRPGTDIVPLAAGLFNREVYLEGIKRRAAMLDHQPGTSAICSIQ